MAREALQDAMDVHGGKAIIDGPSNYLARLYDAAPISITVEGANLLTRNMIIFGQGVIRCHPNVKKIFDSVLNDDKKDFDKLCAYQIHLMIKNKSRVAWKSLTRFKSSSNNKKNIHQMSMKLSYLVDLGLMLYGAKIKQKERINF